MPEALRTREMISDSSMLNLHFSRIAVNSCPILNDWGSADHAPDQINHRIQY